MKAGITTLALVLWAAWGGAYGGELLKDVREWWATPAFFTVIALGAGGIFVAGLRWDGIFGKTKNGKF